MAKTFTFNGKELTKKEAVEVAIASLKAAKVQEPIIGLVQSLTATGVGGGRRVDSATSTFTKMLTEKKKVHEDEMWKLLKWGRRECLNASWGLRKKGDPKDFIYIKFERDEKGEGFYVLKGSGPKAPEGFETKKKASDVKDANNK